MTSLWLKMLGIGRVVWNFFWPLLKSKVATFASDPEVQMVAEEAVILAANAVFKTNDTKHIEACAVVKDRLMALGKKHTAGWVAVVVEAAFQKLKASGDVK